MKLIATCPILYKNKQYIPGDELPQNTDMQEIWVECGSAILSEETSEKKIRTKARSVTEQAGLFGIATNSESEENLIGRVPVTERRRKK